MGGFAGAEAPRGALDSPCRDGTALRLPRHRLTHPLAAAQAGGIAPGGGCPDSAAGPPSSSPAPPLAYPPSRLGDLPAWHGRASVRGACGRAHVCPRGRAEGTAASAGAVCLQMGAVTSRAATGLHAWRRRPVCVCVSACWGARAPRGLREGLGDTRKPSGNAARGSPKSESPSCGAVGHRREGGWRGRVARPCCLWPPGSTWERPPLRGSLAVSLVVPNVHLEHPTPPPGGGSGRWAPAAPGCGRRADPLRPRRQAGPVREGGTTWILGVVWDREGLGLKGCVLGGD